jgi:dethiobiotin synthetase
MSRFVVTGTDTGIGKTIFAAGLTVALGARYWKPIQAGLDEETDVETVRQLTGATVLNEAYKLATPCSPHRAAEIDGIDIDRKKLVVPKCKGPLIIEGAGGVLAPITREFTFVDLFAQWQIPVILIARTALGTINHSLLSIEALRARGVPIHGIAFVGDAVEDSEMTIAEMGEVKRLGRLPMLPSLNRATLAAAFASAFKAEDFQ